MFSFKLGTATEKKETVIKQPEERADFLLHYTGNWIWRAVSALIEDEKSYPVDFFTAKLNASKEEISQALIGLEKLGIIRRTKNGYKKILKFVNYSDQNLDAKKLIADHINISTNILNQLTTKKREQTFYRTSFVGTTEKKFKDFSKRMENLLKDFIIESSHSTPEKVYALTFTSIEITTEKETSP
jgi:hypothetical protein